MAYYFYDDWLKKATKLIRFGPDRARVAAELEEHLEDRCEAFEAKGMTSAEAARAALKAMGDPEEIAEELAALHRPYLGWLWRMSQWAVAILAVWFFFSCFGGTLRELGYELLPHAFFERSFEVPEEVEDFSSSVSPFVVYRTGLWEDIDAGRVGGYRWTVPVAYRQFWDHLEEGRVDWTTMDMMLTASSPRFWEKWRPCDMIIDLTDSTGCRYASRLRGEEYDPEGGKDPYFWYNWGEETLFSRSIYLHVENIPDPEGVEWLDFRIGEHTVRIDLRGGEA